PTISVILIADACHNPSFLFTNSIKRFKKKEDDLLNKIQFSNKKVIDASCFINAENLSSKIFLEVVGEDTHHGRPAGRCPTNRRQFSIHKNLPN
ncbi:MAG: hypothetical protein ABI359_13885, partial [Ginsengibacter sp.]